MRALRVVGVTGDGSVVLEDPGRRERYTVPADEQLRAAARGDVTRLGQIAIELESQLRPREIQARIRGGASVDEVAAAAGVPTQKIERFAYPVLLERSRTAELAQSAHPQRADGPDSRTLGETVAHTFGLRGQDYAGAGWDSWKGEDGKWVVVLTWQTGRSDNAAHWAFQPGAHGGTVVALDEHASDLVEGLPARPLRPLGSVVDMARDEDHASEAPTTAAPARAVAAAGGQQPEAWAGRGIAPEQRRASPPPPRTRVETPGRTVGTRPDDTRAPAAAAPVVPKRVEQVEGAEGTDGPGSAGATGTAQTGTAQTDDGAVSTGAPATADALPTGTNPAGAGPSDTSSSGPTSNGVSADGATPGRTTSGDANSTGSDGVDPVVPAPAATATDADADATAATGRDSSATGPVHDATAAAASPAATSTGSGTSASEADAAGTPVPAGTSPAATAPATPEDTTAEAAASTAGASPAAPSTAAPSTEAQSAGKPAGTDTDSAAASPATDDRGTATDGGAADERTEALAAATTETPAASAQDTDPAPAPDAENAAPRRPSTAGSRRTKKGKPVMPSWDEVLLGVRGQR
nr:septation protein SepH [Pseudonocardia sp. EV170527-09]